MKTPGAFSISISKLYSERYPFLIASVIPKNIKTSMIITINCCLRQCFDNNCCPYCCYHLKQLVFSVVVYVVQMTKLLRQQYCLRISAEWFPHVTLCNVVYGSISSCLDLNLPLVTNPNSPAYENSSELLDNSLV